MTPAPGKTLTFLSGLAACLLLSATGAFALDSSLTTAAHEMGAEARIMWFDATANFKLLSTREGVAGVLQRCKDANVNIVVLDVKDISGRVLYHSKLAPRLTEYEGLKRDAGYDLLRVASEEAKARGLRIYASINVFSEGRRHDGGPVFEHPEWESIEYVPEVWARRQDGDSYPASAIGARALEGRLAFFEDPAAAGSRQPDETWAFVEAKNGAVRVNPDSAPDGAVLFVGSGEAGRWLADLDEGSKLEVQAKPRFVPAHLVSEMHNAVFVNPANREAQDYELSIIREIASNYDVDGIILDRMRYPGLNSDFSDGSRRAFEKRIGRDVENWPEDVMTFGPLSKPEPARGPLFKDWIEFRASVIRDFLEQARDTIKDVKPEMGAAVYVGSWYWSYYPLGVNWASDSFRVTTDWASKNFSSTGYADLADWITTGCYYPIPSREAARAKGAREGGTVEAAAEGSVMVIDDATFTYAGLYVLDYRDDPERFAQAMQACRQATQGVMLFDVVYIEQYGWWDILKREFAEPAPIPHEIPELKSKLRRSSPAAH